MLTISFFFSFFYIIFVTNLLVHNCLSFVLKLMFVDDLIVVVVVEFVIVLVDLYSFDDDVVEDHWMVMNDVTKND